MKWTGLWLCWCCLTISPVLARVTASSHLDASGIGHGPGQAFDGDLATSWIENAAGSGTGEWIQVTFERPVQIETVTVFGGVFTSSRDFFQYNHLKTAHLLVDTPDGPRRVDMTFLDTFQPVTVTVDARARSVRLVIDSIHAGALYSDTAVAEIAFNLQARDPEVLGKIERWKVSRNGMAALNAADAELNAARERAPGGDPEAVRTLGDAVRRGLEPRRRYVSNLVPPGFMMAYLSPYLPAVEALKALKRLESAGDLEQGTWIAPDVETARYLQKIADYIRAWHALNTPPRPRLPTWGTTGIERGALAGRGEPLALAVSLEGRVYVCDIGNNRVQRFNDMGRVDGVTAGEPGLADTFLGTEVPYYPTGAQPGECPGRFTQPLAIVAFRTKAGDRVAVLDATRSLQVLDADLRPLDTWKVETSAPLHAGVGISGPSLIARKSRLYCLWGTELFAYDLDGTLEGRFTLPVTVRTAVLYRRNIVAHAGGNTLRRFGLDAFDFGVFAEWDSTLFIEDVDLSAGPDGFLYVHTDQGKLIQFTRRGKLRGVTDTFGKPTPNARLAAGNDAIYVSFQDHIHRFPLP